MMRTLFISIMFSLPIVFGGLFGELLKRKFSESVEMTRWMVSDTLFVLAFLSVVFGNLQYAVLLGPKAFFLAIVVLSVSLLFSGLKGYAVSKFALDEKSKTFIANFPQAFILVAYVAWVGTFVGGNLSFFSNLTLGELLSETLKYVPLFAYAYLSVKKDDGEPHDNYKPLAIAYSATFLAILAVVPLMEKLFRFYVPNAPLFMQATLGSFALIFLLSNGILLLKNSKPIPTAGNRNPEYAIKFSIVALFATVITTLI